ncbi:hypothetical protein As57867_016522, partial [Aphanomyces stellatus]
MTDVCAEFTSIIGGMGMAGCTFGKDLAANQIDVATVKKNDCPSTMCTLSSYGTVVSMLPQLFGGDLSTCMFTDTSTKKKISAIDIAKICDGIVASPVGISSGALTPMPSSTGGGLDPCLAVTSTLSVYSFCAISTNIRTKQIDVAAVKKSDCSNTICSSVIAALSFTGSSSLTGTSCILQDTSTGKAIPASDLASICAGAQASGIGSSSNNGFGTTTVTVDSGGISTGAIVGIVIGCLVVVGLILFAVRGRFATHKPQQINTPYAMEGGGPYEPPAIATASTGAQSKAKAKKPTPTTFTHDSGTDTTTMSSTSSQKSSVRMDMTDLEVHRVALNQIRMVKVVAQGAFGEVWVGEFMGDKVAIKKLLPNRATPSDVAKFIAEVKLVAKIDCPYVVKFLGVAWTRPADMLLVTEFMDGGDLRNVLDASRTKKTTFSWSQKLECALHIAEGLVFLHSMDPMVLHRDLKSR